MGLDKEPSQIQVLLLANFPSISYHPGLFQFGVPWPPVQAMAKPGDIGGWNFSRHFIERKGVRCLIGRLNSAYLKKIGLDINDLSNYSPVTNLTHLSKIIERAVLDQLGSVL